MFIQTTALPLGFLIALIVLAKFSTITTENAALTYSVVALLVLTLAVYFWLTNTVRQEGVKYRFGLSIVKTSLALLLMSSGGLLLTWTDVLVLGVFESEVEVGMYSVASKIAMLSSLLLVSVNAIIAPRFSRLYAKGDYLESHRCQCNSE